MIQQTVLITGASSGIGKATAHLLAARGYLVFAAARRLDRLEAMRSANIEPLVLDVTSEESVQEAIEHISKQTGRIDTLVNAAGYATFGALEEVTHAQAQQQFEVNVFGLMRVVRAVLPMMRQQHAGRIINVSSLQGKLAAPLVGWYSASKYAVEGLSDALRVEVAPFNIEVVVIEPGSTTSEFADIALQELQTTSRLDAYKKRSLALYAFMTGPARHPHGPETIADTIYTAMSARHPRTRYAAPAEARRLLLLRRISSDRFVDRVYSRMLQE